MEINQKKRQIQIEAKEAWIAANKIGTCEIITGMGKTFLALDCLRTFPPNEFKTAHLFLAEQTDREFDLLKDIKKYNEIHNCDILKEYNLTFLTYQTARKYINKKFGLVIADEIHDSMTPVYSDFYINNDYQGLLGLSAKIQEGIYYDLSTRPILKELMGKKDYVKKIDILNEFCPIIYSYNIIKGQEEKTSRKLNIYIIKFHLNSVDKNIQAGSINNRFMQTEEAYYKYLTTLVNKALNLEPNLGEDLIKFNHRKNLRILATSNKRQKFLYSLPTKEKLCNLLLKYLKTKTIIFGNDIDALEKITPNVVSSKKTDEQNDKIRDMFDRNVLTTIGSFKKLKQGANLKYVDNCILHSYYSSEIDFIQRIGRLRENKNKEGNVFILLATGTQEEVWIKKMLENTSTFNTKVITMDDFIKNKYYEQCNN